MIKNYSLSLMLICLASLQTRAQIVIDSLVVPYSQAQVWNTFHLGGRLVNLHEHYIEVIDFSSGGIKRDSIPHGFLMETAPGTGKMAGLSSMLCHDLNLNYYDGDLFVNFYHYLMNENKYSRNTIRLSGNTATTSSLKTRYAGTSAPYTWKDYWIYFDLGINNHLLMMNSKTGSTVYQTPPTKYITSSSTNGHFTVKGNEAAYVVKDAGAGEAAFCLLDLERKHARAKKITLPGLPPKGSFNKIVSNSGNFYFIYTSNLELPDGKAGVKAYFVEVDFDKSTVRTACITDHIKDLGRLDGTPHRLIVEEDFAYLSITRQDSNDPGNRAMPFLKEFLRIDLQTMQIGKILEERAKMSDEIFPSNGKYLTKHYRMKDYKTIEAIVYYLREL